MEQVASGGPAARAGLQAGGVITTFGSRLATDFDSSIVAVRSRDPVTSASVT